jgi:hypothetical protein
VDRFKGKNEIFSRVAGRKEHERKKQKVKERRGITEHQ